MAGLPERSQQLDTRRICTATQIKLLIALIITLICVWNIVFGIGDRMKWMSIIETVGNQTRKE